MLLAFEKKIYEVCGSDINNTYVRIEIDVNSTYYRKIVFFYENELINDRNIYIVNNKKIFICFNLHLLESIRRCETYFQSVVHLRHLMKRN